ncbi:MAG: hypothetical protein ACJAWL_002225 [Motiliproteus sp.]|jgi:hypothetical protein
MLQEQDVIDTHADAFTHSSAYAACHTLLATGWMRLYERQAWTRAHSRLHGIK